MGEGGKGEGSDGFLISFFWGEGGSPSPAGLQRGHGYDLLKVHDKGLQPLLQVCQVLLQQGGLSWFFFGGVGAPL